MIVPLPRHLKVATCFPYLKNISAVLLFICMLLNVQQVLAQSCNCTEYIYLNEPFDNSVLKFEVGSPVPLVQKTGANGGPHWYPGTGVSEVLSPHGLSSDLNGNLYIGGVNPNDGINYQRQFNCDGDLKPVTGTTIPAFAQNTFSIGNTIYANARTISQAGGGAAAVMDWGKPSAYDLCTGAFLGTLCLNGASYEGGSEFDNLWGFSYNENTEMVYVTRRADRRSNTGNPNAVPKVWAFTRAQLEDGIANGTCIDPLITMLPGGLVTPGDNFLPDIPGDYMGITSDNAGNMYIVAGFGAVTYIFKYNAAGQYVSQSLAGPAGSAFSAAIGIVWSETSNRLYVSHFTNDPAVNCISAFDAATLTYLGTAAPNPGGGSNSTSKAIGIIKECCPVNLPSTFTSNVCGAVGARFYLNQEAFSGCDGIVCGSSWTPVGVPTGMTFDPCDNSVIITGVGCGTFTLDIGAVSSTGCGAQSSTFTICNAAPTVTATTSQIAATCNGLTPNDNGIVRIATVSNGTHYAISTLNAATYNGPTTVKGAISIGALPFDIISNAPNAGGTYIVRIFEGTDNCYVDVLVTVAPVSCSVSCSLTAAGESLEACNDNGTASDGTDDYITFSLNPTGTALGATYSVTASGGASVTLSGGGAATGISYGSATAFRLQNGSANGTSFTITVTDASGAPCVATTTVQQSACSTPSCSAPVLTVSNPTICGGMAISLASSVTASTPAGTLTFHATPADATAGVNALINTTVAPVANTTYYVRSTTGAGTCFSTAAITVTVVNNPIPTVTNGVVCVGGGIDLATLVSSAGGGTLSFYTTAANAQAGTNALGSSVVTPAAATNYYVRSTISTNGTSCYGVREITVTIGPGVCGSVNATGPN